MFNLLFKALGLPNQQSSELESVKCVNGVYFVCKSQETEVIGVDRETARKQIEKTGSDPDIIDQFPA